ncbi:MAG: response regulator transcription factor [Desulfoferrobacter sp.]
MRTLIVEDNAVFRQSLKEMLWTYFPSMIIEEAADGREALEKMNSFFPNVIFMDIGLPGENGLKIIKRIRTKKFPASIIVLTIHESPEYRDTGYSCGADCFLTKGNIRGGEIASLLQSIIREGKDGGQYHTKTNCDIT